LVTTAYGNTFGRSWQKLDKVKKFGGSDTDINQAMLDMSAGGGYEVLTGQAAGSLKVKDNNRTYYTYGIESTLSHKLKLGETDHKIDVGVRYHYDQIRRLQNHQRWDQDASGYLTNRDPSEYGEDDNKKQTTAAVAVNISDQIKFKKLTFTPGVRVEHLYAQYTEWNKAAFNLATNHRPKKVLGKDLTMVSGGGALKMDVYDEGGQDFDLFGSVHRGVSNPSPSGIASKGQREESSVGYELGMRYGDAPKAFSTEVIFFLTNIDNLIIPDSIGASGGSRSLNAGSVRTRGVEIGINYDHGLRKNLAFQTPMYIAATYTDATFTDSAVTSSDGESIWSGAENGNKLPYITPGVISFGAGVIYNKFNLNLDGNWNAKTWASGCNSAAKVVCGTSTADARYGQIDSYFVLDATVGWQFNKSVRMFSNFKNITQEEYMVSRQPLGPRPGLPFSMMAGLEFSL
jgi:Fe(3+) dicitrate transport protein